MSKRQITRAFAALGDEAEAAEQVREVPWARSRNDDVRPAFAPPEEAPRKASLSLVPPPMPGSEHDSWQAPSNRGHSLDLGEVQQAMASLEAQQAAFVEAIAKLATARRMALVQAQGLMLDLAVVIASVLIERQASADATVHTTLMRAAARAGGGEEVAVVRLSPAAYQAVLEATGSDRLQVDGRSLQMRMDTAVDDLGAIVEGESLYVDGTVRARLAALRQALEEQLIELQQEAE